MKGLIVPFGLATVLASALLFAVQPMAGKMLLPAFGGTPGVWSACMLFFQAALLAGYGYAHATSRCLGVRAQAALHFLLCLAAFATLPIAIPLDRPAPTSGAWGPGLWVFGLLATTVGPAFALTAATSPLLQRWFASAGGRDPFVLYAAGSAGNLAALAAYPLLIEPLSSLGWQARAWSIGFGLATLATLACALFAGRRGEADAAPAGPARRTTWIEFGRWSLLATLSATWLLALTTHVTTELAPMPLLWTVPLGIYLATFIVAFSGSGPRWAAWARPTFPWLATALALVLAAGFAHLAWIPLHLATFFVAALVVHAALAELRPEPARLTAYYLAIGCGGALAGFSCAILAPSLFDRMVEYPTVLVLTCLVVARRAGTPIRDDVWTPLTVFLATRVLTTRPDLRDSTAGVFILMLATGMGVLAAMRFRERPGRFAMTLAALLLAGGLAPEPGGVVLLRSRNFFGQLRVLYDAESDSNRLMHGRTLHGQQVQKPGGREEPSTYFTRSGPVGDLFVAASGSLARPGERVSVVGLGTGTLACYARPGQAWTFYEIDDAVVRVAEDPRYFTYLADARRRGADVAVVEGDARLRLADAPDGGLDLMVLDAFSSDAVPVHLLSREAIALYRRKLAPGGVLAFNLSSKFLDLPPLMARQAADAGLACRVRADVDVPQADRQAGKQPSIWAVMADPASLPKLPDSWLDPAPRPGSSPWTDDYSDLVSYLILGRRPSASIGSVRPAGDAENEADLGRKSF